MNPKNWIIINTKLDTKEFNKQLKEQEKKIQQYSKEAEELLEVKSGFEYSKGKAEKKLKDITASIEKEKIKIEQLRNAGMTNTLPDRLDKVKDLEKQANNLQFIINNSNQGIEKINQKLIENARNVSNVKKQMQEVNEQIVKTQNISEIKKQINGISNSITGVIKKVGRWALAIFGIRTAYNLIVRSISIISQGNNQLKADIDYMKNIIAYTIEPIVLRIVNFLKQMLIYVGYIIYRWTGKNIFENADKSLKNANKNAKALQRTLAGFDEMNIVGNKNNQTEASFNLTDSIKNIEKGEIPNWLDWIIKNGPIVLTIIGAIIAAINGFKFGEFVSQGVRLVSEILTPVGAFLIDKLPLIISLGLIIAGIVRLIGDIKAMIDSPSWENFSKILFDLSLILVGIGIAMLAINAANPVGWVIILIGLVTALGAILIKYWDKIKSWFANLGEKINRKIIQPIKDKFNSLPNWFKTLIRGIVNTAITMINGLISGINKMLIPLRASIVVIGNVLGKNWTLETISIPKIQYMKDGGILNLPGRGVPVEKRGGEAGPEGLLPLTNEEQMDLIGRSIARYLTIELTNVTNLDGRTIARSIKKIQTQNDFVMNR